MDPITAALLAGAATTAVNETIKPAVKDAYEGLKAKVKQWFTERKRPEGEMALTMIEQKPEVWQAPLAEAIKDSGAGDNAELLQRAEALLEMLEKPKPQVHVTQKVKGDHNIFSGTGNVEVVHGDNFKSDGGYQYCTKVGGGIIIPDSAKEKPAEGEIVAVGPGKMNDAYYCIVHEPVIYPVWFGTNREPNDKNDLSKGFSGNRAKKLGTVYYGRCDVAIPKTHRFGETGRAWWKRWVSLDFRGNDHLTVEKIECCKDSDDFWHQLRSHFLEREITERDAVVFLHGFNNSFEDAAIRAAQIGFDLKIRGYTAFFSWPSKAKVFKYTVDESSISASEDAITDFLLDFTKKSGSERVHIIAHSMGNRGLLQALKNIAGKVQSSDSPVEFGQIILAAPDLDVEVFRRAKDAYLSLSKLTTIYSSSKDIPVFLSKRLHEYPRLGIIPPITIEEGIDTVQVNNFNLFNLGHGYFAEAEALLHDIFNLIRYSESPRHRQRLSEQQTEDGKIYWLIDT